MEQHMSRTLSAGQMYTIRLFKIYEYPTLRDIPTRKPV